MKQNKKLFIGIVIGIALTLFVTLPLRSFVYALVSQPSSGSESRLETLYNSLVSLGNGSDSSGSWGNWGSMWNRVRSSSEWVPSGDATAGDVVTGKTFYGGSRGLITGTGPEPVDWSNQMLVKWDDYRGVDTYTGDDDYQGEESVWTNTLPRDYGEGEVWKDERTGLYWSATVGGYTTNLFNTSNCPFFGTSGEDDSVLKNARYNYDGTNDSCGIPINRCGSLSLKLNYDDTESHTEWYLPTQKELMQAYNDGMYNQTRRGFVTTEAFWSSTEYSYTDGSGYMINTYTGVAWQLSKTANGYVRCVARD